MSDTGLVMGFQRTLSAGSLLFVSMLVGTRPVNSRSKGVRGELEARDFLREQGYEAERGQQHAGGADSQDVKHNVFGVHIEVKRVETRAEGTIYDWLEQAQRDAAEGAMPIVLHRRNGRPHHPRDWVVIIKATDFFKLHKQAEGSIW
jgi:hypothetical protein